MNPNVKVYGTDWCGDTRRSRQLLDQLGVAYQYLDIDHDPDAERWVKDHNDGKLKRPTIDVAGKAILSQPSDAALKAALAHAGVVS